MSSCKSFLPATFDLSTHILKEAYVFHMSYITLTSPKCEFFTTLILFFQCVEFLTNNTVLYSFMVTGNNAFLGFSFLHDFHTGSVGWFISCSFMEFMII